MAILASPSIEAFGMTKCSDSSLCSMQCHRNSKESESPRPTFDSHRLRPRKKTSGHGCNEVMGDDLIGINGSVMSNIDSSSSSMASLGIT
mmetsp:Transcript_42581/g.90569  ORF Transcript_42581/g.90569 Transcript_42581/m.90569 type:complete len:90 (-) Transcript_42581:62-331(-)